MTPVVPFGPVAPVTRAGGPVPLRVAYTDDAIRSFVDKLRQLAVVEPTQCRALFQELDQSLAFMVGARVATTETLEDEIRVLTAAHESGAYLNGLGPLENLMRLLPKLHRQRPAVVMVLYHAAVDLFVNPWPKTPTDGAK